MSQMDTPIYDSVLTDLDIDPEEEVLIDHEGRFQAIVDANRSKILDQEAAEATYSRNADQD